jgi:hypothetical protein
MPPASNPSPLVPDLRSTRKEKVRWALRVRCGRPITRGVTAKSLKYLASLVLYVALVPSVLTLADATPMGYHDGLALMVRVLSVLVATALLCGVVAYAGALYWVRVVAPAPRLPRVGSVRPWTSSESAISN